LFQTEGEAPVPYRITDIHPDKYAVSFFVRAVKHILPDWLPPDEVFLYNAFQDFRSTGMIPYPFRVHHGDGTIHADPEAVGFGPVNPAIPGKIQFVQSGLQVPPGFQALFPGTAFRLGLVGTQENMPLNFFYAQ